MLMDTWHRNNWFTYLSHLGLIYWFLFKPCCVLSLLFGLNGSYLWGNKNIKCVQQCPIEIYYNEQLVGDYLADILVENKIILEIKAVQELTEIHEAPLMNYLKASKLKLGILLNFANKKVESKRIVMG